MKRIVHHDALKSNFCDAACGLSRRPGEAGGDPGPKTALGVYLGIKAAVRFRLNRSDLSGVGIAVQGVGGVGYHLCRMLAAEGAHLRVADVRPVAIQRVCDEFEATEIPAENILSEDVEVFAPCALGAVSPESTTAAQRPR